VRREGELTYISARPEWAPPFELIELAGPEEVDALDSPPEGTTDPYLWAWADEAAGTVRSRAFFEGLGITEDEATGAAVIMLCDRLGRPLTVHQGRGSVLLAAPLQGGRVEVGGTAVLDEVRDYRV
jgi:predicted PhzF superfamily epimerase YddE/YHI9